MENFYLSSQQGQRYARFCYDRWPRGTTLNPLSDAMLGCGVCLLSAEWQDGINFICSSHKSLPISIFMLILRNNFFTHRVSPPPLCDTWSVWGNTAELIGRRGGRQRGLGWAAASLWTVARTSGQNSDHAADIISFVAMSLFLNLFPKTIPTKTGR